MGFSLVNQTHFLIYLDGIKYSKKSLVHETKQSWGEITVGHVPK